MERRRIAVIGAGVAGLSAAWLLSRRHDVTLYERETRLGGHVNTVTVAEGGTQIEVDTGFIVYNERNYPQLCRLFDHLGVATQASDMGFSVSLDGGRFEYAGSSLNTLFAQRRRFFDPGFLRLVRDVIRFNRSARALARGAGPRVGDAPPAAGQTVAQFLAAGCFGDAFVSRYLLPMAACIWSCPPEQMREFPARSLCRFFDNHGLLDLGDRPVWRTVSGGAARYVDAMMRRYAGETLRSRPVESVTREAGAVAVADAAGERRVYDAVVMAAHADETLAMIGDANRAEKSTLGAFAYQPNRALLHTDARLMPARRRVWSSWNYTADSRRARPPGVTVTYWMNQLQRLGCARDYFVTLNPAREPDDAAVLREMAYSHPVFDAAAMRAQVELRRIQGAGRLWFCGSYLGYGFHEDGLRSAIDVARRLGCAPPWEANDAPEREATRAMALA